MASLTAFNTIPKTNNQSEVLLHFINQDIAMISNHYYKQSEDFFFSKNPSLPLEFYKGILYETIIGKMYSFVIKDPFITILDGPIHTIIYNLLLWYFILQIGILSKKIRFTIKGGFTIQLMLDSQYNTEDIDIKTEPADAKLLYHSLVPLIPSTISDLSMFVYLYKLNEEVHHLPMFEVIHSKPDTGDLYKFTLEMKPPFDPSNVRPRAIKKAFIDIDFSKTPKETENYFQESKREIVSRYARFDSSSHTERFTFLFPIYSFDSQFGEKVDLLEKYKKKILSLIVSSNKFSNDSPIKSQLQYYELPSKSETIYEILKHYYEHRFIEGRNKMESMSDDIKQLLDIKVVKPKISSIHNSIQGDLSLLADEFEKMLLVSETVGGETVKNFFFYIFKFQKSHKRLSTNTSKNVWSKQSRTMKNQYFEKYPNNKLLKAQEKKAEQDRKKAEQERIRAEEERLKAEQNRLQAEKRMKRVEKKAEKERQALSEKRQALSDFNSELYEHNKEFYANARNKKGLKFLEKYGAPTRYNENEFYNTKHNENANNNANNNVNNNANNNANKKANSQTKTQKKSQKPPRNSRNSSKRSGAKKK